MTTNFEFINAAKYDSDKFFNVFLHLGLNCMELANGNVYRACILYNLVLKHYTLYGWGESIIIAAIEDNQSYKSTVDELKGRIALHRLHISNKFNINLLK